MVEYARPLPFRRRPIKNSKNRKKRIINLILLAANISRHITKGDATLLLFCFCTSICRQLRRCGQKLLTKRARNCKKIAWKLTFAR